jgi:hypothetical protein
MVPSSVTGMSAPRASVGELMEEERLAKRARVTAHRAAFADAHPDHPIGG